MTHDKNAHRPIPKDRKANFSGTIEKVTPLLFGKDRLALVVRLDEPVTFYGQSSNIATYAFNSPQDIAPRELSELIVELLKNDVMPEKDKPQLDLPAGMELRVEGEGHFNRNSAFVVDTFTRFELVEAQVQTQPKGPSFSR